MPKIRSIHPDACESEKLLALSDGAERTLWRLTTHSDDDGRGVDHPKLLANKLYPLDDTKTGDVLDDHLDELVKVGMLVRYQVDGKRYYEVHDFTDWQKPKYKADSKLPAPEDGTTFPPSSPDVDPIGPPSSPDVPHGVGGVTGEGDGDGEQTPSSTAVDTDGFEQFWEIWPRRNGKKLAKDKAHRAWARMTLPDRRDAYRGARNYADASARGLAGAKDAFRWLQGREWPDWQTPAVPDSRASPAPSVTAVDRHQTGSF